MEIFYFKNTGNAFNFAFEKWLDANETIILKMPVVSANKRGVNDIGWISNGDVRIYGTFSENPRSNEALWQEINVNDEINKTTSALKIENRGDRCKIEMRAILN